jgi:hypothetical protein
VTQLPWKFNAPVARAAEKDAPMISSRVLGVKVGTTNIKKGQYMYFSCNTTHGGHTYVHSGNPMWHPCLHIHLDSEHIPRIHSTLNYATEEAKSLTDYFPPEHHRSSNAEHIIDHIMKSAFEFETCMESLKRGWRVIITWTRALLTSRRRAGLL